eukprot:PhM_4_TR18724/c3_g1_i3/m.73258
MERDHDDHLRAQMRRRLSQQRALRHTALSQRSVALTGKLWSPDDVTRVCTYDPYMQQHHHLATEEMLHHPTAASASSSFHDAAVSTEDDDVEAHNKSHSSHDSDVLLQRALVQLAQQYEEQRTRCSDVTEQLLKLKAERDAVRHEVASARHELDEVQKEYTRAVIAASRPVFTMCKPLDEGKFK